MRPWKVFQSSPFPLIYLLYSELNSFGGIANQGLTSLGNTNRFNVEVIPLLLLPFL